MKKVRNLWAWQTANFGTLLLPKHQQRIGTHLTLKTSGYRKWTIIGFWKIFDDEGPGRFLQCEWEVQRYKLGILSPSEIKKKYCFLGYNTGHEAYPKGAS